jgi:ubiquinone/menaquinone biosynthesis C-methylase UbiE
LISFDKIIAMKNEENEKIKSGIKNTFDTAASSYDTIKHFGISAREMVSLLPQKNNLTILDLSTGTGHIAIELAKKFGDSGIHGVDISAGMLKIAQNKVDKEGLKNITLHNQDIEKLDLGSLEFDVVTCGYGLFFYPNLDAVYINICKKIKKGGMFVFSTFTEDAFEPYTKTFLDMLESEYSTSFPQQLEKRSLKTKEEILELASISNPRNIEIEQFNIRYPLDIEEWWNLLEVCGYKGLLNQLEDNYDTFKNQYISKLKSENKTNTIDFNADTYFCIVTI